LTARRSAKCIVVDPDGRVLLFKGIAPRDPSVEPWWFCPGGGLEGDEGYPEAARRELFEETGIVAGELGEVILERDITITWDGAVFDQHERYFLVRADVQDVSSEQWTDEEREVIIEHRWWTLDQLHTTPEPVFPPGIAELVSRALGRGQR
jgi:8-oxo-dGTP pyrophosphatase MutT (NUDIX family)